MRDTKQGLVSTPDTTPTAARPYYEALNMGCDAVVRCHDCSRLATCVAIQANKGLTPCCGTRKVREVRSLRFFEWLKIRLGILDFPYRAEFLREFARGRA